MPGKRANTAASIAVLAAVALAAAWGWSKFAGQGARSAPHASQRPDAPTPALAPTPAKTAPVPASPPSTPATPAASASSSPASVRVPAKGEAWSKAEVPAHLHRLFGLEEGASHGAQMEAAAALPAHLSDADVAWLHAFLRWTGDGPQGDLRLNAVKNDVSEALQRCEPKRRDYAALLLELHRDPAQDPVWRDYCLQHMGQWYASADADQRPAMLAAMREAARSGRDGGLAGTALIALRRNIGVDGLEAGTVRDAALEVVEDASADALCKITALQVCASLGDARALPQARLLARSATDTNVRASAIAALGFIGDPAADGALLREFESASDARLRMPAKAALERLASRATPSPSTGSRQ